MSTFQDIPSFDPQRSTTQQGPTLFPVYDTLTSLDAELEPLPWLATSWEQLDPQTWRFELRDDVVFHDGSTFDASVVKANLDRAAAVEGSPNAQVFGLLEEVTVVDANTVDVGLVSPAPNFPFLMAGVAGIMISPQAIESGADLTRAPAGSGGWIWQADENVEGSLHRYEANPDYWNPDVVKVQNLEMHVLADVNARLNAFQSGQTDITAAGGATTEVLEDLGFDVITRFTNTSAFMLMDREGALVPALADPLVREAIGLLIDREAYSEVALSGVGYTESGGFVAPGLFFYNEEFDGYPQPDVDRAKELLAEAGYPDGFSMQIGSVPVIQTPNEAIAQLLARGGIDVEIVTVGSDQYTAEVRKGTFPAAYLVPTSVDIYNWWARTVSPNGTFNPFGVGDLGDLEARYQEAIRLTDLDEQKAIFDELQREAIDRGVIFALGQAEGGAAFGERVQGHDEVIYGPDDGVPRPFNLCVEG